ncbi:hypothetical protein FB45DRAFT_545811 [Roridomyces roridus]|uniref:LYR motif-containing protein Cup1-like N-terminal domain-containing protein n=1 Tax=Roridomyces roridus TaxID=1738132 RepID=A0AAD7FPJ2_9AGAR|nr:hypothetical protein FB45DRAFT_545811 [Roridomyces roridus]
MKSPIVPLYRAFLRQARKLPHIYLRQFWRIKASDDVRAVLKTELPHLREKRLKRIARNVRLLESANAQHRRAFTNVLNIAYGRKGKLKRELLEPLLHDPTAAKPPRIIPAVESSRPPVYSKELKALLTSGVSRTTKALSEPQLAFPPTLPSRADPSSDQARLLGPLSKRRQVNIRWRYFTAESKKVWLPLQVVVGDSTSQREDVREAGIRALPMQGLHVHEDVESIAAPSPHISRWVRRRYRSLLDHLPILTYNSVRGKYTVSSSPNRLGQEATVKVDSSDLLWMQNKPSPRAK